MHVAIETSIVSLSAGKTDKRKAPARREPPGNGEPEMTKSSNTNLTLVLALATECEQSPNRFAQLWQGTDQWAYSLCLGPNCIYIHEALDNNGGKPTDLYYGIDRSVSVANADGKQVAEWLRENTEQLAAIMEGADCDLNAQGNRQPKWSEAADAAWNELFGDVYGDSSDSNPFAGMQQVQWATEDWLSAGVDAIENLDTYTLTDAEADAADWSGVHDGVRVVVDPNTIMEMVEERRARIAEQAAEEVA